MQDTQHTQGRLRPKKKISSVVRFSLLRYAIDHGNPQFGCPRPRLYTEKQHANAIDSRVQPGNACFSCHDYVDSGFYSGQSGKVKNCLTTGLFYDRNHRSRVGPGALGLGGPGSQQLELFVSLIVLVCLLCWCCSGFGLRLCFSGWPDPNQIQPRSESLVAPA